MKAITKEHLKRLETLMLKKKGLDAEIEATKAAVIEDVELGQTITAEYGAFTVSSRSKFKYSPELEARAKAVKADEKREVQEGIAETIAGEPFLTYRLKGEE